MGQKNTLYFCAGLTIGILGTLGFLWFYQTPETEPKPEVKSDISEHPVELPTGPQLPKVENTPLIIDGKSSIDDYVILADRIDYAKYIAISNTLYNVEEIEPQTPNDIRRVTEEQFEDGNIEGNYDICGLTLYGDGILADATNDDIMSDADAFTALGPNYTARKLHELFERALDYSDDPIFIRNDKFFTQYEISYDRRTYKEVTGRNYDGTYGA